MKYFKLLIKSFIDFFRDGGIILAGSISYFFMMAFLPLCIFLITIFGFILGYYEGFYEFFSNRLMNLFPENTSEITNELRKLVRFKGIGTFSIILYGLLSYQVFASLENALNIIFKVEEKRNFLWSIIISLFIITLIILMLVVSFIATSLISLLKTLKPIYPQIKIGMVTVFLISYLVPFLMVLFSFSIIYIFFPRAKIRVIHAITGAFFTAAFLEIVKHIFAWYVGSIVKFGTIYGPLSTFVLFLLWVYYSSCIFLIGAEFVHNLSIYKKS